MAWGAPTPCSSGGRSAVSTSIGTSDEAGLDDGGVEVRRRGPAGAQHAAPGAGGEAEAEGDERRRPLVVDARARARSSRAASASAIGVLREPGATHGVGDAAADPLVDQRGAERRLHRGGGLARSHRPRTIRP